MAGLMMEPESGYGSSVFYIYHNHTTPVSTRYGNTLDFCWKDRIAIGISSRVRANSYITLNRMRTGKRNRHRRPDSPDPNPKSKRDDISINQLT
ncbi:hypothetical protein EVAR_99533_1 [Eumeta japonica]|uniref:Uncharacterized protein n=1 Tax=Eumeta variegata TaxID=151549 RepID=A0A4C1SRK8_EUMVA|nr:hypothetical protein EVAR_99533_1 [Eumeta japonica]